MIEAQQDLWTLGADSDAIVITTNGTIMSRRLGVMGRGCALEAAERYNAAAARNGRRLWTLQRALGNYLELNGNHVGVLVPPPPHTLVVFPVKHEWQDLASLPLIEQSAIELVALTDRMQWTRVVLPRPGCGNGGMVWETVKGLIGRTLDDRFTVVTK